MGLVAPMEAAQEAQAARVGVVVTEEYQEATEGTWVMARLVGEVLAAVAALMASGRSHLCLGGCDSIP